MSQLAPSWQNVGRHGVFPEAGYDAVARFDFLAGLNGFLSRTVAPGIKTTYEQRFKPAFERELLGFCFMRLAQDAWNKTRLHQFHSPNRSAPAPRIPESAAPTRRPAEQLVPAGPTRAWSTGHASQRQRY